MQMDRRQKKTREAIFSAFSRLLEKKSYNRITVQDIIDEADIGRSTFYAHFETKDELLNSMCRQIFGHIFSNVLKAEKTHDFSEENKTLTDKLTHLLYHLKEQKKDIIRVLSGESGDLFLRYFKMYLAELFTEYKTVTDIEAPEDFVMNHYVSSFAETVKWWADKDMRYSPEEVAAFYGSVTKVLFL